MLENAPIHRIWQTWAFWVMSSFALIVRPKIENVLGVLAGYVLVEKRKRVLPFLLNIWI